MTNRRRAFTLVELLVVIGIIAILVAILLPALSRARAQANQVKCSAALREIAHCFTMYSKENRDKYPVVKFDYDVPPGSGNYAVLATINGTPIKALYWIDFLSRYTTRNEKYLSGGSGNSDRLAQNKQTIF